MSGSPQVSICICTYRRPRVAGTIRSVLAQQGCDDVAAEIVVCDDDPAGSARAAVTGFADERWPVRYVASAAGNVAAARNVCLDAARGEWIAFIDDDENAAPDWLARLLVVQSLYDADVVKGFVRAVYPADTPPAIRAADPYTRDYGVDGAPLTEVASGNVLFRRGLAAANAVRFDVAFGLTGGEDTDFFHRYAATGARMVAARSAVVDEIVPPERVTWDYFRRRYLRMGQTSGRRLGALPRARRASELARATVSVAAGWIYPALMPLNGRAGFVTFRKFWFSRGLFQGCRGIATEQMN